MQKHLKCADITIEVIVNLNLDVNLHTKYKFVRSIWWVESAIKMCIKWDIQNLWMVSNFFWCKWKGCEYLHVTLASDDDQQDKALKKFPCAGCKNSYGDVESVVRHVENHTAFYLCLNCDDWIKRKDMVIYQGWTLFNQNGELRTDV